MGIIKRKEMADMTRFIGFNYCVWPSTSYTGTEAKKNFVATYYKDGNSQPIGAVVVNCVSPGVIGNSFSFSHDTRTIAAAHAAMTASDLNLNILE